MASTIADRVREAREALGYTPKQAEEAGSPVKAGTIWTYERDKEPASPQAAYLEWLAEEGVSADYLLRGIKPVRRPAPGETERRYQLLEAVIQGDPESIEKLLDSLGGA